MQLQVRTSHQVLWFSTLITLISVAVPLLVVGGVLWHLPREVKLPILAISGLIPLGIAFPVSLLGLSIVRKLYVTMEALTPASK